MPVHALNVVHSLVREALKRHLRSPHWRSVEKAHLKLQPACVACGGTLRLQVHHIIAFENRPELELEPTNLLTLCMGPRECHLKLGHGGSFRYFVRNVRPLAIAAFRGEYAEAEKMARDSREPIHPGAWTIS